MLKKAKVSFIVDPVSISKKQILKSMKEIAEILEKLQRVQRKLNELIVKAPLDRNEVILSRKRLNLIEALLEKTLDAIPRDEQKIE